MIGNQYKLAKEYYAEDTRYDDEYVLDIGDIVEVVEIRSTSYGVKLVESSATINPFIRSKDEIKFLSDGNILLRIPKNVIVDKEWFHPFFRESNLNELLK